MRNQGELFTIKREHMMLLHRLYWVRNDDEYGAPTVDPKKPYGNSRVIQDIIRIVEDKADVCPNCGEVITKLDEQKYADLHEDLLIVLEILAQNAGQGIEVGDIFVKDKLDTQYRRVWVKG